MKAREVLEQYVDKFGIDQLPSQFADWVIKELSEAGFVILPKEVIDQLEMRVSNLESTVSHAEGEKG